MPTQLYQQDPNLKPSLNFAVVVIFLYRLLLKLYGIIVPLVALFNEKAGKWVAGRRNLLTLIEDTFKGREEESRIWIHCASLGEFEQGRPVIEALKQQYPQYKIVLTFFSPSGYEVRKNYEAADYIFYLPHDGKANARRFIAAIKPKLALFVKYEFWYFYMQELESGNIPAILLSATFRPSQAFFKWYGSFFRNILNRFTWLLVQDKESELLLTQIGLGAKVVIGGDTRYDRVAAIAANAIAIPQVEQFKGSDKLLIAGSTWPADEQILKNAIDQLPGDWKLVIAPHEIGPTHIRQVTDLFGDDAVLFSSLNEQTLNRKVLVIDNIGMLSSLYRYGELAMIGGGFSKSGIHNVLEPAVFGLPVITGPYYTKFVEARAMVALNYVYPVTDSTGFNRVLGSLVTNTESREALQSAIRQYMVENTGATNIAMNMINRDLQRF